VRNENGQPVAGALVYRNGQPITDSNGVSRLTNSQGVLTLTTLFAGDKLVALQPISNALTNRAGHNLDGSGNFAYRVFRTSMPVNQDGNLNPYVVPGIGQSHPLTISLSNTLILFNVVVSLEWDANDDYIQQISDAARLASDYLYDLSDGQMAFGQVAIYDNRQFWADADIQVRTWNNQRPQAHIGGITASDKSHVILVGRGWDQYANNSKAWNQFDGFSTLVHEFGHYALYLYDEYKSIDGATTYCTGPNPNLATRATNASVMDWQYTNSEFSARGVSGLWSVQCEETTHWQMTERQLGQGESPWQQQFQI
jgi:hypothetical protein